MAQEKEKLLTVTSSPHIFSKINVSKIMGMVILALIPATIGSIIFFGLRSLFIILTSIITAVVSEIIFKKITKKDLMINDLSAVVTGLLLALILPPGIPLWMVAIGSAVAIIVTKELFGGLGQNPFNPALVGRAVLLMSWPQAMTTWNKPFTNVLDGITQATPLGIIKTGGTISDVMKSLNITNISSLYKSLFVGNIPGSIGETSALLILIGGLFLILFKVIDWQTPLAFIGSNFLLSLLFGKDPAFSTLAGGILFGAFFMATDYVTTPLTIKGKWIFGLGAGLITFLIRNFGGYPEGVTYGILIMNAFTPFLDSFLPKKYGFIKEKR